MAALRPVPTVAPRRRGFLPGLLAALALAAIVFPLLVPAAALAASPTATWGAPNASGSFGQAIQFSETADLGGVPKRVELLLTFPGAAGPNVVPIDAPSSAGSTTLRYSLDVGAGGMLPNTVVAARWRVTWADGTTAVGPEARITYADDRFDWQTKAGRLVRIHWYRGDQAFGTRALAIAEDGVAKAEQLLGISETQPIDFFVYADQQAFYDALGPGTRENVGGEAVAGIRTLFGLITPDELNAAWVGIVIPHELTHLVFDTAVHNPYHFPPRWLNEGLAVYLSQGYVSSDRGQVDDAVRSASLMPLTALTGQFPTTADRFALAYAESVSAVDFLVRTFGRDALVTLIRSYARGVTDDEAFRSALGVDVAGLESRWLADLGTSAPKRFGPQPAPAGPVPSGWTAGIAAPNASGASGVPGATASAGAIPAGPATARPGAIGSSAAPAAADDSGAPAALVVGLGLVAAIGLAAVVLVRRRRRRPNA